jgi:hypothetical protein
MNSQRMRRNAPAQMQLARPEANAANQSVNLERPEQRRLRVIREAEAVQDDDPEYPVISFDLLTVSKRQITLQQSALEFRLGNCMDGM